MDKSFILDKFASTGETKMNAITDCVPKLNWRCTGGSLKIRKTAHCALQYCTLQKMYPPTGAFNESGRLKQPYFGSNLDLHSLVSSALEDAELVSDPDLRSDYSKEGFNSPPVSLISYLGMRH